MDAERRRRVEVLLQSTQGVSPEDRATFLQQACGGDASLEEEVWAQLNASPDLGGFLDDAFARATELAEVLKEDHDPDDTLSGQTISHYRVLRKLDRGGMGVVYEAEDVRLGRHVALKVVRHSETDSKALLRFQQEARALSSLSHPNICTVFEAEEHDGRPVIVMELLEGETLKQRLRSGAVPLAQLVQWGSEISDALEAAHARGVIHRDIKPANLFITTRGTAKILDFGLAKLTAPVECGASRRADESLTSFGMIRGTTPYMSPEQARGEALDERTDLFSLGIVLYEMATGRRPFEEKNLALTLDAVLHTAPPLVTAINPDLPQALAQLIAKALDKDRERRYQHAFDLRCDLRALEATATFDSSPPTARFFIPRGALILAALLVLVAAGAFGWRSSQRASRLRWAEETAVPQIARLIQDDRGLAALKLFREAERYAPASRSLFRLAEGVAARPVAFETTPPGARIYISDYAAGASDDLSEWQLVGEAPVKIDQVPIWGYYRIRATKAGFARKDLVFGGGTVVSITLQPESAVPPGMVEVPATAATSTTPAVALPAFWIDRFEVTNRQFKAFVDAGGYQKPEYWKQAFVEDGRIVSWHQGMSNFRDLTGRPGPATWLVGSYPEGTDDVPIGGVSWYEAMAYTEFAGKSLPTVYEWNQAAGIGFNSDVLHLSNFGGKAPASVGTHRGMNPFGTFDMAGNLKEWAANAAGDQRYILGAGWDEPAYLFSYPDARQPFARESTFGFRCVQRPTAPPEQSFAALSLSPARAARPGAPVGDETYNVFLNLHRYTKSDLDARVERVDESSPYWRRETATFRSAYGNERVIAHLFLPKNTLPPYQVVAMMGGSTITDGLKRIEDFDYPFEFIVRSGRAVLIPAYSGTLERGPSVYHLPDVQERERGLRWSMDLGRSIDYLETRSDIDTLKLGYYGISSGAAHGVRLVTVDGRFKAAVLSSGGLQDQPAEIDSWNFAPRFHTPVLMVNGRNDFRFPVDTNQNLLFDALGTKEPDKKHILYDGGHRNLVTRPDLIGEVLDWFDRYLGPVRSVRATKGL